MIRQVTWSEVSARIADAPARADRRPAARAQARTDDRPAGAATLVERVQDAVALTRAVRPVEGLA
jgi:hypothetical protein